MPKVARVVLLSFALVGCGTGNFDVPKDDEGQPTIASISDRIECELVGILRQEPGKPGKARLLAGDYGFAAQLALTVSEKGALTPSFLGTFANGAGGSLLLNGGFTLSKLRDDNIVLNLSYSMGELERLRNADTNGTYAVCEDGRNLAGDLGIAKKVALILSASNVGGSSTINGLSGEFGGYINFQLVRSLDAVGPTWVLDHFKGPGNLAAGGVTNTQKITFAFAPGTGKGAKRSDGTQRAKQVLQDLLSSDINRKLDVLTARPQ